MDARMYVRACLIKQSPNIFAELLVPRLEWQGPGDATCLWSSIYAHEDSTKHCDSSWHSKFDPKSKFAAYHKSKLT